MIGDQKIKLIKHHEQDQEDMFNFDNRKHNPTLFNKKILFNELCGSVFQENDLPCKPYITYFQQDDLFTWPDALIEIPKLEMDVYCNPIVSKNKQTTLFFSDTANPSLWMGFVVYTYSQLKNSNVLDAQLNLELVYVKPEFRGKNNGKVFCIATARELIDGILKNVNFNGVELYQLYIQGQGTNPVGAKCLNSFANELETLLYISMSEDGFWMHEDQDNFGDSPPTLRIEFVDEY